MSRFFDDIRHAARGLTRTPGATVIALATLAIGIGSNTAVYTVVRGVLLSPLPYAQPERLVKLGGFVPGLEGSDLAGSPAELNDYRERAASFQSVTGVWPLHTNLVGGDTPVRLSTALVAPNFLDVLGVQPELGRGFEDDAFYQGVGLGMVLSWDVWQRQFGGDDSVIGRTINIDGDPVEVIGVMSRDFHHPGEPLGAEIEAWTTMDFSPGGRWDFRGGRPLQLFGRLADGVSIEASRDELRLITDELRAEFPDAYPPGAGWVTGVEPLSDEVVGDMRLVLMILMGAVGLVLLVTCANVSALLLSRAAARSRQTAVRLALGSGRWQIVRSHLAEGLLLGIGGGVLALGLAVVTTRSLTAYAGQHVPRVELVQVDLGVVGFSLLIATVTGLLFGIAPALAAAATNPRALLAGGGRGSTAASTRLRDVLVVGEISTSVVLVIASGLLLSSFRNLMSVDMGFQPAEVQVVQTYLPVQIDPNEGQWRSFPNRVGFYSEVIRLLEDQPSVSVAAGISHLPLRETNGIRFVVEGQEVEVTARPNAEYRVASEDYFDVMGIPLVRGRTFGSLDDDQATNALVVNQAWVRQHAAGRDPLGLRVRLGNGDAGPLWQVVGVVGDVREQALDIAARPTLYAPYRQAAGHDMTFVFRSSDTSGGVLESAREIVRSVDRDQPAFGLATMDEVVAASVAERTLLMQLVSIFAGLALFLAGLGIFGVIGFSTRQRVRELGIRLALGARPESIAGLVLGRGMLLGAVGIVFGLLAAVACTRVLTSVLFDVGRFEPGIVAGVVVATFAVVAAGCLAPARWASSVDPLEVLRADDSA